MGESISAQILYLNKLAGISMRGRIASRQTCPICGATGKYKELPGRALVCQCGQFPANKLEILLRHQGKTLRLCYDQRGRRFRAYQDAEQALLTIRRQIEQHNFNPDLWKSPRHNSLRFANYLAAFLERKAASNKPRTMLTKRMLARHLAYWADWNIREIKTGDIEDWGNSEYMRQYAPQTRRMAISLLGALLKDAYRRDDIERLPVMPSIKRAQKQIKRLSPEQQAACLGHLSERFHDIVLLMMYTGIRVGEACGLCWDCVDLERGALWIRRTITLGADYRHALQNATKTNQERVVLLSDAARALLDRQPRGIGKTVIFQGGGLKAGFISPETLSRAWKRASVAAGYPIALKNATRHSWACQALEQGHTMEAVSVGMGHKHFTTTQSHYGQLVDSLARGITVGPTDKK